MKHENAIRTLLAEFHEDWMDQEDRDRVDAELLENLGAKLDAILEDGTNTARAAISKELEAWLEDR